MCHACAQATTRHKSIHNSVISDGMYKRGLYDLAVGYNNGYVYHVIVIYRTGLDLVNGTLRDNLKAGIVEPGMSKIKCIKFATEAAITILRIDEAIKIAVCE